MSETPDKLPPYRLRFLDPSTPVSDDPRRIPAPAGEANEGVALVLEGGRVFDAVDGKTRTGSVVVRGNRIEAVSAEGERSWPQNAQVIPVHGKTAMPGLIDLHTHLTYTGRVVPARLAVSAADATLRGVERLRYFIESGITSVRDMGSHWDAPFRLKEWSAAGRIPGPRVFPAGKLITGTGGHGAQSLDRTSFLYGGIREASGPDDWRNAVREQFKAGADLIKLASHFSRAEVGAAIAEAHDLGLKVTADAETFYIQRAVEAGIDCIEHPLPRTEETIRLMAERGVAAVPTVVSYVYLFDQNRGGYFGSTSRRFTFDHRSNLEMVRRLLDAGVKVGVGTDLIFDSYRYLPESYVWELKYLVSAGMSIPEALIAATRSNAEILDMDDRLGTLQPGKLADILVVDGAPDEDLDALARPRIVLKDGRVVVQDGRLAIPPHPELHWTSPDRNPEPGPHKEDTE